MKLEAKNKDISDDEFDQGAKRFFCFALFFVFFEKNVPKGS